MIIRLRSKRLARLFAEVWEHLPKEDQTLLSSRTRLVVDSADFLPKGYRPTWGTVISITFRKSITVLYLSQRKLPRQSDDFIKYVIAHLLAHIYCGHIDEVDCEERQDEFEMEAQERVRQWGLCVSGYAADHRIACAESDDPLRIR